MSTEKKGNPIPLHEGMEKRGGRNPEPTKPKPNNPPKPQNIDKKKND